MSKNQRRIEQRKRAVRDLELETILSTTGPKFYDPKFREDDGSLGICSACGECTRTESDFLTMCSMDCRKEYDCQFEQFGLTLKKGANILFDGQKLKFCTWRLKKNDAGEPCLIVYDPDLEDEYKKAPEILVPLSAKHRVRQI